MCLGGEGGGGGSVNNSHFLADNFKKSPPSDIFVGREEEIFIIHSRSLLSEE